MFLRSLISRRSAGLAASSSAVTSCCAPLRLFHTSLVLQSKAKASAKRRTRKRQKKRSPSVTEAGVQHARPDTQLLVKPVECSKDERSVSTSASIVNEESIQEREKGLLRYFGRARHHYDTVPLHAASAALQCASNAQASRVPLATLFPPPAPLSRADKASTPHFDDASTATSSLRSHVASPSDSYAFSAPDLFLGYSTRLSRLPDFAVSRALRTRFDSNVDANKLFGALEVRLEDIAVDMSELWWAVCGAWEEVVHRCLSHSPPLPLPTAQSVCFVVNFSQTQQTHAVAASLRAITEDVVARCKTSRATASAACVFAVVPIYVGLEAPSISGDAHERAAGADNLRGALHGGIEYSSGGFYTCSAVTQCLARMAPHTCTSTPPEGGGHVQTRTLDAHIFLISDAWLLARSVADLHSGHRRASPTGDAVDDAKDSSSSSENAGCVFASSEARGDDSDRNKSAYRRAQSIEQPPVSFLPEASRQHIHVFPGVVSEYLSATERRAFGSYLWSAMQRACAKNVAHDTRLHTASEAEAN